jgi:hypothetical protein
MQAGRAGDGYYPQLEIAQLIEPPKTELVEDFVYSASMLRSPFCHQV